MMANYYGMCNLNEFHSAPVATEGSKSAIRGAYLACFSFLLIFNPAAYIASAMSLQNPISTTIRSTVYTFITPAAGGGRGGGLGKSGAALPWHIRVPYCIRSG